MRGAAFTSEKRWMTIKKKFAPQWAIDTEFFHRSFVNPILVQCKTKGAVGAVCA